MIMSTLSLFLHRRKARKAAKAIRNRIHEIQDIASEAMLKELDSLAEEAASVAESGKKDNFDQWLKDLFRRADAASPPEITGSMRYILDLLAVVLMVAGGLRGVFLQPFQIPTSSMQPTLYGIHSISGDAVPDNGMPGIINKILFSAGQEDGHWTAGGDHLFVDRLSIHIKPPARGDVIVFTTEDINTPEGTPLSEISGTFYIKRLIGLPGDTIRFTENGVEIKPAGEESFRHITEFAPQVEKLYSGKGGYQKHSPFTAGNHAGLYPRRMNQEITVPEDHYYMLGDNVAFSSDSRIWGFVPRANIVGRALVVFWPFTRRWGLIDTKDPLAIPTGRPGLRTFEVMSLQ